MSILNSVLKLFKKKQQSSGPETKDKIKARDYIGKFVHQNGVSIGESIGFENDSIVVKSTDVYMSIPLEKITANAENIVVGDFNREESVRLGKEWFERKDALKFDNNGMLILDHK